ncbi:MAG TPA: S-methyl-5'-thioadenosine phosphorylase [Nitrospiraceae bacterium]|nr:S-methyl-5'-thioadenosine phosphorylase [Nitrospiraceae bacterium]
MGKAKDHRNTSSPQAQIGIIGGSGLYEIEGLQDVREVRVRTPFGHPSDALIVGTLGGVRLAFLSRHGRGHRFTPSEINYRANIYALKSMGVTRVISVSAVGSMKEMIKPGDLLLPDQFIDLTKRRIGTFFGDGVVAHVAFAEPICLSLADILLKAGHSAGGTVHRGGTYLCIEGPQFSSRAESLLYRKWGVDVIGMTNLPEAKLAREAELCYATLALVTDYDCWHESEETVTVEMILATLHKNVALAKRVLRAAVASATDSGSCVCGQALKHAIVTAPEAIPPTARRQLDLLIGRHLPPVKKRS